MKDKPVISIWGIGPSYRLRVKEHIEEALNSGYENIMDFIILTDDVSYFDEICKKTDKIKAVINLHEERKISKWPEVEWIPESLDEKNYGEEYRKNWGAGKNFCYSLKRYSLPKIAELGYNKAIFLDGDVKIKYDKIGVEFTEEEFWEEFNTPPNSMKGCVKETLYINRSTNTFHWTAAMGYDASYEGLQLASIVLNKMYENHNITNRSPLVTNFDITEGPFRYYHFRSVDDIIPYLEIWDESMYHFLSNPIFKNCTMCGGYMLCDYLMIGVANIFFNMQVLNFPNKIYNRRIFYEDRYFLPPMATGLSVGFNVGETLDDFYDKNKELVDKIKNHHAWPHIEPL